MVGYLLHSFFSPQKYRMKLFKNILPLAAIMFGGIFIYSCNNADKTTTTDSSDTSSAVDTSLHDMNKMHDTASVPMVSTATAMISSTYTDTSVTGTANFETIEGKVKMTLSISVPAQAKKSIAVNIHEHGDCSDNGKASHGHWNPSNTQHGKWGAASFHAGDIGNIKLDAKGNGTLTISTDLWTLGGSHHKNILGKAIIVHSGVDDFTTQPTGNAGNRIGCGLIMAK